MKKYEVRYSNGETVEAIDTVYAPEGYTAEEYVKDCEENADQEWVDMIHAGFVELIEVE